MHQRLSLTIESDASRIGWGAKCTDQRTGGPWSREEQTWHINCLEAWAVFLAVKCFARNMKNLTILLKIDNMTTVAYINNLGGTVSPQMNRIVKNLWLWCLQRDIHLQAEHLPGVYNTVADEESRVMKDRSYWTGNPEADGPAEAKACNAFLQDWRNIQGLPYANPPWSPVEKVVNKAMQQKMTLVLVSPVWKTQAWYPMVLNHLVDFPYLIPQRQDLIIPTSIHPVHPGNATSNGRLDYLRERFSGQKISKESTELLLASWRQKSAKSHDSLFNKWVCWCNKRNADPVSGPISDVVNFLADLFKQGYEYRSLNAYRSAISSVHTEVEGYSVGQHPLICRVLKGVFNSRPPKPRYQSTWSVKSVLTWMEGLGPNSKLSLTDLSHKLAMLLCLVRPMRSSDVAKLDLRFRRYLPEGVSFQPANLTKQDRPGMARIEFFSAKFAHNSVLCPVETLRAYEKVTEPWRPQNGEQKLFLGLVKPHKPVVSSTIARWLKGVLEKSGINTDIFNGHSTRAAAVTTAASAGITIADILQAADWSSESVFQKFYYKPSKGSEFADAVLSVAGK